MSGQACLSCLSAVWLASCNILNDPDACRGYMPVEYAANVRNEGWRQSSGLHALATLSAGDSIVVYHSASTGNQDETSSEIRGTLIAQNGMRVDSCSASSDLTYAMPESEAEAKSLFGASVAFPSDPDKPGLIVYAALRGLSLDNGKLTTGDSEGRIWGAFVDKDGCPLARSAPFPISENIEGSGVDIPEVIVVGDAFVVLWRTYQERGFDWRLYARTFRFGLPVEYLPTQSPVTKLPGNGAAVSLRPAGELPKGYGAVALDARRWALAYRTGEARLDGAQDSLWLAIFDAQFNALSEPYLLHRGAPASATTWSRWPSLAFDGQTLFAAWGEHEKSGLSRLHGRMFALREHDSTSLSLEPKTSEFQLGHDSPGADGRASLASTSGGRFFAAWDVTEADADADTSGASLRFTALDSEGRTAFLEPSCGATDFQLNVAQTGEQRFVSIAAISEHAIQAVWTDGGQTERNRRDTDVIRSLVLTHEQIYSAEVTKEHE